MNVNHPRGLFLEGEWRGMEASEDGGLYFGRLDNGIDEVPVYARKGETADLLRRTKVGSEVRLAVNARISKGGAIGYWVRGVWVIAEQVAEV